MSNNHSSIFGDQFFWGDRIHEKGLGVAPIPISVLNVEALSDAIRFMLQPEVNDLCIHVTMLSQNYKSKKIPYIT